MKKKITALLVFLLLLAVSIGTVPKLLKLEKVRTNIVNRLSRQLGSEITIHDIHWAWFPFPHLSLLDTQISYNFAEFTLPEIRIYPEWRSILNGTVELRKIYLRGPHIHLNALASQEIIPPLLQTKIVIDNGLLTLKAGLIMPDIVKSETLSYSTTHSELLIRPESIKIFSQGATPFSKDISVLGQFNISDKSYLLEIDCKGLMLFKSVTSLAEGKLLPVGPEVTLTGYVQGTGLDTFKAGLKGDFPCFLVKPQDRKLLVNCGFADMFLEKSGNSLSLKINNLELKEPGLTLRGSVARHMPNTAEQPLWHINLSAQNLNLSEIREGVLTLWAENKTAAKVCNIVLGGKASTATFQFNGPASDFNDIRAMTITADVTSAPIHVSKGKLDLAEASGPITIKEGMLAGQNLSARLGDSLGKNCSLLLDLSDKNRNFKLDIDLDADLVSLPAVLHNLIDNTTFINELNRFRDINGRASGHLSIGDTLDDIVVRITVDDIKAKMVYDRLKWPVDIQKGTLLVAPGKAKWQGLQAAVGPHFLNSSSGAVSWETELYLNIGQLSATLDSGSFYAELLENSAVPKKITKVLSTVQGPLILKNTTLYGPVQRPAKWEYHLDVRTEDVKLTSPLLPGTVTTDQASFSLSHNDLVLSDCMIRLFDHPLKLKGNFKHSILERWHGQFEVNGTVHNNLAGWIRKKNWVPNPFFPRIPCTLKDFNISWDTNTKQITGGIIAGTGQAAAPMAVLDITSSPERLHIKGIDFIAKDEQGSLSLDLRHAAAVGPLFVWKGNLRANTIDRLLENNMLVAGALKGDCRLDLHKESGVPLFKGFIEANDLLWRWGKDSKSTAVADLFFIEKDNRIAIEKLNLQLDQESITMQGSASEIADGLKLQLNLASPNLTWDIASDFLADLQIKMKKLAGRGTRPHDKTYILSPWDLTGEINFSIDSFSASLQPAVIKADPAPTIRTWKPLIGRIELHPLAESTTHITTSSVCGIDMTGTLYSDEILKQGSFVFSTSLEAQALFQEVLPCLGIKQKVIEGAFDLNASFQGKPGQWTDGNLKIVSSQGRILRMKLLSQIFSIINITDLFSTHEVSDIDRKGFAYSKMDLQCVIKNNRLIIRKAVIRGEGLNLFGKGEMDLISFDTDFTILIAPLKSIDALVGKVPLVGKAVGGEDIALVAIPVGVKGNANDPQVTILPPQALGDAVLNLVKETVKLPFSIIFSPILSKDKETKENNVPPSDRLLKK